MTMGVAEGRRKKYLTILTDLISNLDEETLHLNRVFIHLEQKNKLIV